MQPGMRTAAILGTNGYTGQETLDRLLAHRDLEVVALGSDSLAGESASALDVRLNGSLPPFLTNEDALHAEADVVFWCLGHEQAAALEPPPDALVVDLSGAHRLQEKALYPTWYGFDHPGELDGWSYALPELCPPTTRLIANPGCYVTAAVLALAPLRDVIDPATVVVDAKSGVSGAGRTPSEATIAGAVLENMKPYAIGRHRHLLEMQLMLGFAPTFVPHLLPIRRGLIATCYVNGVSADDARRLLVDAYEHSDVVLVLPEAVVPEISRVVHTDGVEIGVFADPPSGRTIVISAEDNLGKGAAGQAMQNANLALGLPETDGLRLHGVKV